MILVAELQSIKVFVSFYNSLGAGNIVTVIVLESGWELSCNVADIAEKWPGPSINLNLIADGNLIPMAELNLIKVLPLILTFDKDFIIR